MLEEIYAKAIYWLNIKKGEELTAFI